MPLEGLVADASSEPAIEPPGDEARSVLGIAEVALPQIRERGESLIAAPFYVRGALQTSPTPLEDRSPVHDRRMLSRPSEMLTVRSERGFHVGAGTIELGGSRLLCELGL